MPEAVPRQPRRDDTAADAGSLARMGRIEEQPIPAPTPSEAPPPPDPAPDPADEQEAADLTTALASAGIDTTDSDKAAVRTLASLDAATVETVTQWLKAKKNTSATK
jgi:hypothetical protein